MVQKRCRSGFNTGSTLRMGCGRRRMQEHRRNSLMRFKYDDEAIGRQMDSLWLQLSSSLTDNRRWEETSVCLSIVERLVEMHECLNMDDETLAYSLNKRGRWGVFEDLLALVERLSSHWECVDLRARVVVIENEFCTTRCLSSTERKSSIKCMDKRKTKNRERVHGTKRSTDKDRGKPTQESSSFHAEYYLMQSGCKTKIYSRSPRQTESERNGRKRQRKSKSRKDHEYDNMRGVSASKFLQHSGIGYKEPKFCGSENSTETKEKTRSSVDSAQKRENSDEMKSESQYKQSSLSKTNEPLFLTEVQDTDQTCTEVERNFLGRRRGPQRAPTIWKFIERNFLQENSDRKVVFTNCKDGVDCSRRLQSDPIAEQFVTKAERRTRKGLLDDKEGENAKESNSVINGKKYKKKRNRRKKRDIHSTKERKTDALIIRLKWSAWPSEKIRAEFGSRFRETTVSQSNSFWINISSEKRAPDNDANAVSDYLSHFQAILVFRKLSQSPDDEDRVRCSSAAETRNSFHRFELHPKIHFCSDGERRAFADRLDEALHPSDSVLSSIATVVRRVEEIYRQIIINRESGMNDLSPPPPSLDLFPRRCPPVPRSLNGRWNLISRSLNWKVEIHSVQSALNIQLQEERTGFPRPASVAASKIGRSASKFFERIDSTEQRSEFITSSSSSSSLRCVVCRRSPSNAPPLHLSGDRPKDEAPPVVWSCGHSVCSRCWKTISTENIANQRRLDKCPAVESGGCHGELDSVVLLLCLPLKWFWNHLLNCLLQKLIRHPQWKLCPNVNCKRPVRLAASCILRSAVVVDCFCGRHWCFHCLEGAHWPASCSQSSLYNRILRQEGIEDRPLVYSVGSTRCSCRQNVPDGSKSSHKSFDPSQKKSPGLSSSKTDRRRRIEAVVWSTKRTLPRIGSRFEGYDEAHSKGKNEPIMGGLVKMDLVLKNDSSEHKTTDKFTILSAEEVCLCSDEICIKCINNFENPLLKLSPNCSVERVQSIGNLRCSNFLPLLFYRSAINHRSRKSIWTLTAAESNARLLAKLTMKSKMPFGQRLTQKRREVELTNESDFVGKPIAGLIPGEQRSNGAHKHVLRLVPQSPASKLHRKRIASAMETDVALFLSVHEFVFLAHCLLESVYAMFCANPSAAKTVDILKEVVKMEEVLDSIDGIFTKARVLKGAFISSLIKDYDRARGLLLSIVKQCNDN